MRSFLPAGEQQPVHQRTVPAAALRILRPAPAFGRPHHAFERAPAQRAGRAAILTARAEPCPCGSRFTALDGIEGRCDDLFYLPALGAAGGAHEGPLAAGGAHEGPLAAGGWVPVFPDFVRRALLASAPDLE